MNYRLISAGLIVLAINLSVFSQGVVISESPNPVPEPSAILDVQSTTKGFLPPRLTFNQRTNLANPATGLVVYDTDMHKLYVYASDQWVPVVSGDHWVLTEENNLFFNNGHIGIGTGFDIPAAPLHVHGTGTGGGNVLFSGEWKGTPGPAPATGSGTRLVWYPDKAAFRAGRVSGTQWNTENIGNYSTASGYNTTASGWYSNAWGSVTAASGSQSSAWGFNTTASGTSSTAFGENTTAPSFAETVIGYNNTSYTPASSTAWVAGDRLFVIGNGSAGSSDALVMLKNGNTGLGISDPLYRLHASGSIYATSSSWVIRGVKTGTGTFPGVWGETESSSANANGIRGFANNTTSGTGSAGVYGKNFSTTNSNYGVFGEAVSTSGRGVYGYASAATGSTYGVYGRSDSPDGIGVYGYNATTTGTGGSFSGGLFGVRTYATGGEMYGDGIALYAESFGASNEDRYGGQFFTSNGGGYDYGVYAMTDGSFDYGGYFNSGGWAGFFVGDVSISGNLYGGTDAMLLRDIREPQNSLGKINQLQVHSYEYKTEEYDFMNLTEGRQYGFIAQEVEQVFPELVKNIHHPGSSRIEEERGNRYEAFDYKGINYIGLIPVLTEAIKELNDIVEEQRRNSELQEKRIRELERMLYEKQQ
jgi:hypothetical protein